jgi:hypothetical protein
LEDTDEMLGAKPWYLLQHVHVRLNGIESQPDLNGAGIHVLVMSGESLAKQCQNGTVGMIVGLVSKPQLNGRFRTVKSCERFKSIRSSASDLIIRVEIENIYVEASRGQVQVHSRAAVTDSVMLSFL